MPLRIDKRELRERIRNFDAMSHEGHMIWLKRYHKDVMDHSSPQIRANAVSRWKRRWTIGSNEYKQVELYFKFSLLKIKLLDDDDEVTLFESPQ